MSIGLRERKKLKTRAAIQKEAMRLFLKKGFEATTIEEIAEAVEISPSTFFNYFPSKEDVVLQDDLDPLLYVAFASQPPDVNPLAALRNAMRSVFSHLTPDQDSVLKNRLRVQQVAELMASRLGRSPDDFALRNLSGALMGVMIATFMAAASDPDVDLLKLADEAMAHLEAGLPLDWTPKS